MTLESIYYIGQTVAVVALLASLVFVGLQVRHARHQTEQANKLARAEMSLASAMKCVGFQDDWYATEESAGFMTRVLKSDAPLSVTDKHRFGVRMVTLFTSIEIVDMLYREELCDPYLYDRLLLTGEAYCALPQVQKWWARVGRAYFLMPFRDTMDAMMQRGQAAIDAGAGASAGAGLAEPQGGDAAGSG
jgi:hypothetical protein